LWIILSFIFVGKRDGLQFWSSVISLLLSIFSFVSLYAGASKNRIYGLNYIAWGVLALVTVLELIFLISLLVTGNAYELVKTSYGTLRIDYFHTLPQILLLFGMGIVGIITLLVASVAG
jgi:hypothetical protein